MQLIECPYCGQREEVEFHYGGAAGIAYPEHPAAVDDTAWARYLFFRPNPQGAMVERWFHSAGCRQWLRVERDTVSYRFSGAPQPIAARPITSRPVTPQGGLS